MSESIGIYDEDVGIFYTIVPLSHIQRRTGSAFAKNTCYNKITNNKLIK